VTAALSYLVPGRHRPVSYVVEPPPGEPWESGRFESRPVSIQDARARSTRSSVHREGFELWDAPSQVRDFHDPQEIRRTYYAESAELALAASGGRRAWVFDHLVRRREPDRPTLNFGRGAHGTAGANARLHNDYTQDSGTRRLALVVTDEAQRLALRRFCVLNIWRSIRGPVHDTPLAVCDARTVQEEDFVTAEVRYADRVGEVYFLKYSPDHRWNYYSAMDRHEALVFKQFDSMTNGVARFTPHGAFDHPGAPADAPPRESIELRCLVGFE
jgi:hypothetical protein